MSRENLVARPEAVSRGGVPETRAAWIERTTSIVPHHKTQSVELRQGPLARWRGLATVEVHTPKGPVDANGFSGSLE